MDAGLDPDREVGRDCHGDAFVDDLPGWGWIRAAGFDCDPCAVTGGISVISWLSFFVASSLSFGFMYDSRPIAAVVSRDQIDGADLSAFDGCVSTVDSDEGSRRESVRMRKRRCVRVTAGLKAYVKVLNSSSERQCLHLREEGMKREREPTVYPKVRRVQRSVPPMHRRDQELDHDSVEAQGQWDRHTWCVAACSETVV